MMTSCIRYWGPPNWNHLKKGGHITSGVTSEKFEVCGGSGEGILDAEEMGEGREVW